MHPIDIKCGSVLPAPHLPDFFELVTYALLFDIMIDDMPRDVVYCHGIAATAGSIAHRRYF